MSGPDVAPVLVEIADGVAVVTLNRPQARNALNVELMKAIRETMAAVDSNPDVRAIVLTGSGKAFCAGLDLKELGSTGDNLALGGQDTDESEHADIENSPWAVTTKPIVGAINGPAVTGGFELALNCDILIGSDRACFADTHTRVGVMPGWGLSVLLPLVVGRGMARRMSLTGDFLMAPAALKWGLLTEVVPETELLTAAVGLARTNAGNEPAIVQAYLRSYRRLELQQLGSGYAQETTASLEWLGRGFDPADVEARRLAVLERGRSQAAVGGG